MATVCHKSIIIHTHTHTNYYHSHLLCCSLYKLYIMCFVFVFCWFVELTQWSIGGGNHWKTSALCMVAHSRVLAELACYVLLVGRIVFRLPNTMARPCAHKSIRHCCCCCFTVCSTRPGTSSGTTRETISVSLHSILSLGVSHAVSSVDDYWARHNDIHPTYICTHQWVSLSLVIYYCNNHKLFLRRIIIVIV